MKKSSKIEDWMFLYKIIWNKIIINQCHYYSVGEEKLNFDGHGKNNWKAIRLKWESNYDWIQFSFWIQTHNKKKTCHLYMKYGLYEHGSGCCLRRLDMRNMRCEMRDWSWDLDTGLWLVSTDATWILGPGGVCAVRTGISSSRSEQWPGPPLPLPRL